MNVHAIPSAAESHRHEGPVSTILRLTALDLHLDTLSVDSRGPFDAQLERRLPAE